MSDSCPVLMCRRLILPYTVTVAAVFQTKTDHDLMVILKGCKRSDAVCSHCGYNFQMCILVTGQFGKSISYNKFLVLKVVCIYFLLNGMKLGQVVFNCVLVCLVVESSFIFIDLSSTEGVGHRGVQFNLFFITFCCTKHVPKTTEKLNM